jgi:hypothetical protein
MTPIKIFKGSDLYSQLLDSFSVKEKIDNCQLETNNISKTIYLDLAKMKLSGWRMKINFRRHKRHTIAEFFQDIIVFYLNATLPDNYQVELEKKINKTQIDIAIKKDNEYIFLIEVKTTIGYERPDKNSSEPYKKFSDRVKDLSQNFRVLKENIIYIFEDHGNVGKEFSEKFWDKKNNKPKKPPTEFPYSIIKPLFNGNDPYYWKQKKGINRQNEYTEFDEATIFGRAEKNIVTKFEDIVKQILSAKKLSEIE